MIFALHKYGCGGGLGKREAGVCAAMFIGETAKHVSSCRGTHCFQENSRGVGGWRPKESGGHMSPLQLSAWVL